MNVSCLNHLINKSLLFFNLKKKKKNKKRINLDLKLNIIVIKTYLSFSSDHFKIIIFLSEIHGTVGEKSRLS
jgi:hypothetical protein